MNVNEEMTADNGEADDCDLNADADYATCCWDMFLCYRWTAFDILGNILFPVYEFLNAITCHVTKPIGTSIVCIAIIHNDSAVSYQSFYIYSGVRSLIMYIIYFFGHLF